MTRPKQILAHLEDHRQPQLRWLNAFMRLAAPWGIIAGVSAGLLAGAILPLTDVEASTSIAILAGIGAGPLAGVTVAAANNPDYVYDWDVVECNRCSVLPRLNAIAAANRYVLTANIGHYYRYDTTQTAPVAAGPTTLGADWLNVIVQFTDREAIIVGPKWIVKKLAAEARQATSPLANP